MAPPLQVALWRQNAPANLRGTLFSVISIGGAIAGTIVSFAISQWLGDDPGRFLTGVPVSRLDRVDRRAGLIPHTIAST